MASGHVVRYVYIKQYTITAQLASGHHYQKSVMSPITASACVAMHTYQLGHVQVGAAAAAGGLLSSHQQHVVTSGISGEEPTLTLVR